MQIPIPGQTGTEINISILIDGKPMNDQYQVSAVHTTNEEHAAQAAAVTVFCNIAEEGELITGFEQFAPGASIQVIAGYDKQAAPIFSGYIKKHRLEITPDRSTCTFLSAGDVTVPVSGDSPVIRLAMGESIISYAADFEPANADGTVMGTVSFQGAHVKPGDLVLINGIGANYNGSMRLLSVTHIVEMGVWTTVAKFSSHAG